MSRPRQSRKLPDRATIPGTSPPVGVQVYEALQPIGCTGCPTTVPIGGRFTRRMMRGGGAGRTYPFCRTCEPFQEDQAT
jgi:hypothetical protein